ncbi:MAG: carbohydrate ABC transporter permease [Caldilineaceae bacterium]
MNLQRIWTRGAIYLVLLAFAVYYAMPIYVLVITGLKPFKMSASRGCGNCRKGSISAVSPRPGRWSPNFQTSVMITVPAALISSMIGSINGYVFAKWRFKGRGYAFYPLLSGYVPALSRGSHSVGLNAASSRSLWNADGVDSDALHFRHPITALLFRGYYAGIPSELLGAAKIDGCGFFGIYRWILLPISMPAFAVVLLWQFTTIWNDYLIGLVVLSNPVMAPVNVAVKNVAGSYSVDWNVQMAAALIAAAPTIIVYLALGKLFMRGLLAGSLKG